MWIIFFVSAKNIKRIHGSQNNAISQYLTITGFGFLLTLVAISPAVHVIDLIHTPFPPFATLTWAFLGFSTYLVSAGFYLSAVRISQDIGLRKSIRQVAIEESSNRLLDNIGTAQMEQAIQDRVQKIAKEQEESLKKETGIHQDVSQEDVEAYVKEVLEEVKKYVENRKKYYPFEVLSKQGNKIYRFSCIIRRFYKSGCSKR